MAERTRALEEKLSDALHAALTQRFVDRRTTVLLRDMGQSAANLPVEMEPDGTVCVDGERSEEHTSELQSLMRNSYAVFCLKKKNKNERTNVRTTTQNCQDQSRNRRRNTKNQELE